MITSNSIPNKNWYTNQKIGVYPERVDKSDDGGVEYDNVESTGSESSESSQSEEDAQA